MGIKEGSTGQLIDAGEGNVVPFTVMERFECQGQHILWLELHARQFHVPATLGYVSVKSTAAAIPIFIDTHESVIINFMKAIKSRPLAMVVAGYKMPAVNMDRLPGFWDGEKKANVDQNKTHLLAHARDMIKLWDEWRGLKDQLPSWFRTLQIREDLLNRGKGLVEIPFKGLEGINGVAPSRNGLKI